VTEPQRVDRRPWIVDLPVEPVVVQRIDRRQLLPRERPADGIAREAPLAAGLTVDEAQRPGVRFGEEVQLAPFEAPLEGAHGTAVLPHYQHQGNTAESVEHRALPPERCE